MGGLASRARSVGPPLLIINYLARSTAADTSLEGDRSKLNVRVRRGHQPDEWNKDDRLCSRSSMYVLVYVFTGRSGHCRVP